MIILAIETSTKRGGAALVSHEEILIEAASREGVTHSKTLIPTIHGILDRTGIGIRNVDLIAVDVGPGSFTGLRIGLSVAKGLALAAEKPLVGVSSLDIMVRGLPQTDRMTCPVIDARKKEVYAALYKHNADGGLELYSEPAVLKPEALAAQIEETTIFLGDGVQVWGKVLSGLLGPRFERAPEEFDFPKASIAARLGWELYESGAESDPAMILPAYVRLSEAELMQAKIGVQSALDS